MPTTDKPFDAVDSEELAHVAGGSARLIPSANKDDSAMLGMVNTITQAISNLSKNASKSDPMTTMLPMILAMGGKKGGDPPPDGGGGGPPPASGAPPAKQA
jgi:hypothetical protein